MLKLRAPALHLFMLRVCAWLCTEGYMPCRQGLYKRWVAGGQQPRLMGKTCEDVQCSRSCSLEHHLRAAMSAAHYQQALRRYHSRKVHARSFEEGDLVLRRVQSAKNSNKLTPKWEGPYRVIRVTRPGAVRLETEDGIPVSNSWNIEHLRKFYP